MAKNQSSQVLEQEWQWAKVGMQDYQPQNTVEAGSHGI